MKYMQSFYVLCNIIHFLSKETVNHLSTFVIDWNDSSNFNGENKKTIVIECVMFQSN